jgi:release factor glutamine methyltransferase
MTLGQLYQSHLKLVGRGSLDRYSLLQLMLYHESIPSSDYLFTHLDEMAKNEVALLISLKRCLQGEPVAYITGQTTFCGLTFRVDSNVLIPRPETEELVMHVLQTLSKTSVLNVVDIGTGSGAIAIALKVHRPLWKMIATDISAAAVNMATQNALRHHVDISFFTGNGLQPFLKERQPIFDLVVSNPPYILDATKVDASVKDYEPHLALFAKPITKLYQQYLEEAKSLLKPGGTFAFEISPEVVEPLTVIVKKIYPQSRLSILKDINLKSRIAMIYT